jgi:dihydroorotate dehydrogenase electron transfer subunit
LLSSIAIVEKTISLENSIYLLKMHAPEVSRIIKSGQFLNIKVSESNYPLLRRPYSICDVDEEFIYIMFNLYGEGTRLLANKRQGDKLEIVGPLGNGFNIKGNYSTAILVAGGMGSAPFPFLIEKLENEKKDCLCFVGAKNPELVISYGMKTVSISTDNGLLGFHGTVVELLNENLDLLKSKSIKIFGCGPTAMLKALRKFSLENNFECEVSTECAMACGFGICQGCPIESAKDKDKYLFVCKDGPVFNIKDIVF